MRETLQIDSRLRQFNSFAKASFVSALIAQCFVLYVVLFFALPAFFPDSSLRLSLDMSILYCTASFIGLTLIMAIAALSARERKNHKMRPEGSKICRAIIAVTCVEVALIIIWCVYIAFQMIPGTAPELIPLIEGSPAHGCAAPPPSCPFPQVAACQNGHWGPCIKL